MTATAFGEAAPRDNQVHYAALSRPDVFEDCVGEITSDLTEQIHESLEPVARLLRDSGLSRDELAELIMTGFGMAMDSCVSKAVQSAAPIS